MDINSLNITGELDDQLSALRQRIQKPESAISDVIDDEGNQYVDLVLEGGGMLGIALIGYTWALEQMGIRFLGIAGTSAGAINALLLAALDEPAKPKSSTLFNIMANKNFYDFVDGEKHARELIKLAFDKKASFRYVKMLWQLIKVRKHLCSNYGLNKGDAILNWLHQLISDSGINTLYDLDLRLSTPPKGLRFRDGTLFTDANHPSGRMVLVATDITTETRVEFPAMAKLYWADPQAVSPALFARASMAVPLFFEPLRVSNVPTGERAKENWKELAGYGNQDPTELIPEPAIFVDGGVVSNFPINVFHCLGRVPTRPTFGVKLKYDNRCKLDQQLPPYGSRGITALLPLLGTIFNSARNTLDYEFIKRNPDYNNLVAFIPCTYKNSEGNVLTYKWLDFNMPETHKIGLFVQGACTAIDFVNNFSASYDDFPSKWEFYKALRKKALVLSKTRSTEIAA